jgi:hypothetical protein
MRVYWILKQAVHIVLRRADHSSKEVLPSVSMITEPRVWGGKGPYKACRASDDDDDDDDDDDGGGGGTYC